ncbi:MAG: 1-deoxy-D-xylulose-5-phosphate reductoisomerase [Chloroflexota bacterium]
MDVKRIAILGSTGSIGRQTLDVIRAFPLRFQVVALAAGKNLEMLQAQIAEFRPSLGACDGLLSNGAYTLVSLEEMASHPQVDMVVVATAGKAGLSPTLTALRAGKGVALANKEVLVMAGEIVMTEAKKAGVQIRPVDSEHSALWQCLQGEDRKVIFRLILTASGGPFRHLSLEEMARVTAEEALHHPTWLMGQKVTIDAATLMNKGMEAIEAHWLFEVPYSQIEIAIHPQSIVHSLVEFVDGSLKAQLGPPDMRLPIQYALTYPQRWANTQLPRLSSLVDLHFSSPDLKRFPCLRLALEAGEVGGTMPSVLCAADEVAVGLFLAGRIGFMDIPRLVEGVLGAHSNIVQPTLESILAADVWAREWLQVRI